MKLVVLSLVLCLLTGCSANDDTLDRHLEFRSKLMAADEITFDVTINAYYPKEVYNFQLNCRTNDSDEISFTVKSPESIAGISGIVGNENAAITFDDKVLAFPMLADDRLSPVSSPWIFYNTLRNGYLRGSMNSDDGYILLIDDSYNENSLQLKIETNIQAIPLHAEIYYQGNMVIALDIENFTVV